MTEEELIDILKSEDIKTNWTGDNALQGLLIIAKYIDQKKRDLICGAGHDIIYSVDVDEIIKAGITKEDAIELRKLNWMTQDDYYLACFV